MEQYVTDAAHPAKQPQEAGKAVRIVLFDFLERLRNALDPLISATSRKQVAKLPETSMSSSTFSAIVSLLHNVWDELQAEGLSRN
jgi:hypothetical protein